MLFKCYVLHLVYMLFHANCFWTPIIKISHLQDLVGLLCCCLLHFCFIKCFFFFKSASSIKELSIKDLTNLLKSFYSLTTSYNVFLILFIPLPLLVPEPPPPPYLPSFTAPPPIIIRSSFCELIVSGHGACPGMCLRYQVWHH